MSGWRLRWAARQILDPASHRRHRRALATPWRFWLALLLKLVPGLWRRPVTLRLRDGGAFAVHDFMTLFIYHEVFVDGCYDAPRPASAHPTIVDVGANVGLFTLRMKQLHPRAEIHCYEPIAANLDQLARNLALSGIADCRVHPDGVGGRARRERLFLHPRNAGGHSLFPQLAGAERSVEIDLVDLTTMLARLGRRDCDLLKLDCEGAEREILLALDESLARRIAAIVVEPSPQLYDPGELVAHLVAIGYAVRAARGLIVAERRGAS